MDVEEAMRILQRAEEAGGFADILEHPAGAARGMAIRERAKELVGDGGEFISFVVEGGSFNWGSPPRTPARIRFTAFTGRRGE